MLHDNPDLVHGPMMNGMNGVGKDGGADAAERKKALKKAKREQQKMEKAEADKKEALKASKSNAKSADGEAKKEDDDPLGKTLAETKEPLQGAMKFLTPLLEFSPDNVEAQCAGFEVFLRRSTFPWLFWRNLLTFWCRKVLVGAKMSACCSRPRSFKPHSSLANVSFPQHYRTCW
jgi:peptide alpha-N-acetyltransferase